MTRILEIRELTLPLQGGMSNAVVSFTDMTASLVAVASDHRQGGKPVVGMAFNSIGRFGQSGILRERFIPRILAASPEALALQDDEGLAPAVLARVAMAGEKPGGHGDRASALAALELAVWDLNAKLAGLPAWELIAKRCGGGKAEASVPTYAAGGYYHAGDSLEGLKRELAGYRDLGFDAFKIKIGGASLQADMQRIELACEVAGSPHRLAVDANGRFGLDEALRYAKAMVPLGLRWYEEPGDPLDFALLAALADQCDVPLATGENLFSVADTANLLRYGGMRPGKDIFQMDPGLGYGLTAYCGMLKALEAGGFSRSHCYPHGGHLINLHLAAGLGLGGCEAYPGIFEPLGGFSAACRVEGGRAWPSPAPGFGLEEKESLQGPLKELLAGL